MAAVPCPYCPADEGVFVSPAGQQPHVMRAHPAAALLLEVRALRMRLDAARAAGGGWKGSMPTPAVIESALSVLQSCAGGGAAAPALPADGPQEWTAPPPFRCDAIESKLLTLMTPEQVAGPSTLVECSYCRPRYGRGDAGTARPPRPYGVMPGRLRTEHLIKAHPDVLQGMLSEGAATYSLTRFASTEEARDFVAQEVAYSELWSWSGGRDDAEGARCAFLSTRRSELSLEAHAAAAAAAAAAHARMPAGSGCAGVADRQRERGLGRGPPPSVATHIDCPPTFTPSAWATATTSRSCARAAAAAPLRPP